MSRLFKYTYISLCFAITTLAATVLRAGRPEKGYILTTQWTAQSQFAGYIVAEKDGLFKNEGIDVTVHFHDSINNPVDLLREGKTQFAVMPLIDALEARLAGFRLVNIMQIIHQSSYCIASHKPILSMEDLRGEEIAIWHGLSDVMKGIYNVRTGGTVKWLEVFSGIEVFTAGAADNLLVTSYNEAKELEDIGYIIEPENLARHVNLGLNIVEDGIYVTEEFYKSHTEDIERFVKALTAGWNSVYENREHALDLVLAEMERCDLPHNRHHESRALEEILRLISPKGGIPQDYSLTEQEFKAAAGIMKESGICRGNVPFTYKEFTKR